MNTEPLIRSIEGVAAAPVPNTKGVSIQVLLGLDDQMPHFQTRLFTLDPGAVIPEHCHDTIEHEQVMLEGEMVLILDGQERTAKAGNVVYIPANVKHSYENRGKTATRFLCMIPNGEYSTQWS
ncbi:MAG: cupin domain-containing protein [Planctomycetota bacterium]